MAEQRQWLTALRPSVAPSRRALLWVVGLALALRLLSVAVLPPRAADDTGSYMQKGVEMVTDTIGQKPVLFGPVYALLIGGVRTLLDYDRAILVMRLLQAVLGALTCAFIWQMAFYLTADTRIASMAGLGLAVNPIFIIDNNIPTTETVFLFLLFWGLLVYLTGDKTARSLAAAGILLGLATLTRAMLLLFPIGLAIHLALSQPWRRALRGTAVLLVFYGATLSPWTAYSLVKFNRFIVGASGMGDMLLSGAIGYNGYQAVDSALADTNGGKMPNESSRTEVAVRSVFETIGRDPLGYVSHQFSQLGEAVLQPHQTAYFPGESLKALAMDWVRSDRTTAGLLRIINGDSFWPKLGLYIFHFTALLFGVVGILLTRRQWRRFAPLGGLIAYVLLLHFFLLAIPRYLFPMIPALWVFAAVAMVALARKVVQVLPATARVRAASS